MARKAKKPKVCDKPPTMPPPEFMRAELCGEGRPLPIHPLIFIPFLQSGRPTALQALKAIAVHLYINQGVSLSNVVKMLDLRSAENDLPSRLEASDGSISKLPSISKSSVSRWTKSEPLDQV